MSLKTTPLDIYDMLGAELVSRGELEKIALKHKEHIMSTEDISRQLDRDFGIILVFPNGDKLRRFPLNSKANTEFSIKPFKRNSDKLPEGAQGVLSDRIRAACDR